MRKRLSLLISATVAGLITVTACSGSSTSSGQTEATGSASNTVVIAVPSLASDFGTPDSGQEGFLFNNSNGTLVRKPYVSTGPSTVPGQSLYQFQPYLAKSYSVSPNGLVYTFVLRSGVKSPAGNTLNAEDVVYSYQRKFAAPSGDTIAVTAPVLTSASQVKAVNDMTVSFTIPKASEGLELLALLSDYTGYIDDAVLLKKNATSSDPYAIKWSDTHPNYGFGPYEVQDWVDNQSMDLAKNPGFPAALNGGPEYVKYRVVADAGTRLNSLESGAVDIATDLDYQDEANLASTPGITVPKFKQTNEWLILATGTNVKPFDKVAVRQALSYAIPYNQIIQQVYFGRATRGTGGVLDPTAPGYDSTGLPQYNYDPAKAKAMLASAGYPNGVPFVLTIDTDNPDEAAAAIRIQSAAKSAGFDISIDKRTVAGVWQGRTDHTLQAYLVRDYPVTLVPTYEMNLYTARNSLNNLGDWEYQPFYNASTAASSVTNQLSAQAGTLWNAAEKTMIEQDPLNPIVSVDQNIAYRSTITGFVWRSDNFIDLTQIRKSAG
jgi:peptide/nickel transport system substrate-binding protein